METTTEKIIENLINLTEINNDRIQGYHKALKETDDRELQRLFEDMAAHSQTFKNELTNEIARLGGKSTESTKTSGKIFRAWMDIKAALTGKNRKAIISSCEFGEDAALEVYEDVLKSGELGLGNIREIIMKQKEEIQRDHDRIKALKDSVVAY